LPQYTASPLPPPPPPPPFAASPGDKTPTCGCTTTEIAISAGWTCYPSILGGEPPLGTLLPTYDTAHLTAAVLLRHHNDVHTHCILRPNYHFPTHYDSDDYVYEDRDTEEGGGDNEYELELGEKVYVHEIDAVM